MRWWRRDRDGDGIEDEATVAGVQRRLVRVVGPATGGYGLRPDPADDEPAGSPPEPVDPVAARQALKAFDPGRRGLTMLAVVTVVVAVVVAALVWRARPVVQPVAAPPAGAQPAGTLPAGGAPAGGAPAGGLPAGGLPVPSATAIVVAVTGRVHRPGLVRLPPGARVADAIDAAGGALPGTDLAFVNLARKVIDGELLVIGVSPPPGAPGGPGAGAQPAAPAGSGGPVNLNTATLAELDALPGVGPVLAQRIIDYRTRHGGFRSVEELRKVEGVGDARYAQLKDLVAV